MTTLFILIITGIVIAYDVWTLYTPEKTISRVMKEAANRNPLVILAWGVLMGHWFWGIC
jgi:hypothetical protein